MNFSYFKINICLLIIPGNTWFWMNFVMQILIKDTERSYDFSVSGSSDFPKNFH